MVGIIETFYRRTYKSSNNPPPHILENLRRNTHTHKIYRIAKRYTPAKKKKDPRMNTALYIASKYDGLPLIPIEAVCKDFFKHLTTEKLIRKITEGAIRLPIVRIENSQKSTRSIHVEDLAKYIDEQRKIALHDYHLLHF